VYEGVDCVQMAQEWRCFVSMMMKFRLPYRVGNFFTSYVTISFWRIMFQGVSQSVSQPASQSVTQLAIQTVRQSASQSLS